jgi:hypothetical protein
MKLGLLYNFYKLIAILSAVPLELIILCQTWSGQKKDSENSLNAYA